MRRKYVLTLFLIWHCALVRRSIIPPPPREARNEKVRRPVSRVLSPQSGLRPRAEDGHSSGTSVAGRLARPTRTAAWKLARRHLAGYRPYLVLLPVGFALPPPSPGARCALTAPFRPCRHPLPGRPAVWFLWHCPWGRPRRALPGTVFPWSPDFPPPCAQVTTPARQGRPSGRLTPLEVSAGARRGQGPLTPGCARGDAAAGPGPPRRPCRRSAAGGNGAGRR